MQDHTPCRGRPPLPSRRLAPIVTLVLAAAWLAGSCQYAARDARRDPPPVLVQPAPGPGEVARLDARSRWWNYYRRSLGYAQAGDWLRAAWDLEIAMGRRPGVPFGEDQERRRAKIYGLHYLDDYFPHRELGICLFRLGQFAAAEQELLTSLQILPSSRAKFYLNEVRQGRLQSAAVPGSSAFTIDLLPPGEPLLTNRLHVDLRGTISSPAFVSRVSVNGRPLFVELAAAAYALAESVPVVPGEQQVRIDAADLQGRQASISRTIIVDLSGPEIAVSRSPGGSPGEVLVTVVDDRELASVEIDGRALTLAPAQASVASRVVLGGRAGVEVIAVDRAGNRTVLGSTAAPRQQAALEGAVSDWLLAGAAGIRRRSGESAEPVLLAQAAPPVAAAQPDTLPPVLLLSPPLLPRLVVTRDTYVVDLQIEDGGGVAALSTVVNGRQDTKEFQPADADVCRLTRTLALVRGQNEVEIVARDRAGNATRLTALIERREDPAWREDLRVTSHVLPPTPAAPSLTPAVDLYPSLLGALVGALDSQPPRLNLVERDPAVMRQLMIEHALVEGSLADKTRAIRKGKLRTSDWCLVPRVTVWPGQNNFDLFIEVVDVADTSILLTTDIHFTSADRDHVHAQLRGLVAKLEQQLPRLTAPVAAQTGKSVVLPLGAEQQVSRGMYVLFIAADAAALDQDPVAWRDGAWVQGRVTRVLPNSCRVEIEPAKALKLLKANDLALFR